MTYTSAQQRTAAVEKFLAVVFMAVLLFRVPGFSLVPASVFLALLLSPVLFGNRAGTDVRRLAIWTIVAIAAGSALLGISESTGLTSGSPVTTFSVVTWIAAIPLIISLARWSLQRLALRTGVLLMLAGAVLSSIIQGGLEWKGTFGIYVTAFVLVLIARTGFLSFVTLIGVAAFSVTNDARSMAAAALMAGVVQIALRQRGKTERRWFARTLALIVPLVLAGVGLVLVLTSSVVGAEVQQRTINQLSRVNALFGVRAEWASTLALFENRPIGYGVGAQPSDTDRYDAITAVQAAGGDWTSTYFSQLVLGERVDLHSTLANLWFHFGLGGVIVAILVAAILFRGLRDSEATRATLGMGGIFLMLMAIWDLMFSPMANLDRVIAGAVIALAVAGARAQQGSQYPGGTKKTTNSPTSANATEQVTT